jgi:hypothetical protein
MFLRLSSTSHVHPTVQVSRLAARTWPMTDELSDTVQTLNPPWSTTVRSSRPMTRCWY